MVAIKSKDLGQQAQLIWKAPDLESKKILLNEMVNMFTHKSKQAHFHKIIKEATRLDRLDKLASDLYLVDKDKVIR